VFSGVARHGGVSSPIAAGATCPAVDDGVAEAGGTGALGASFFAGSSEPRIPQRMIPTSSAFATSNAPKIHHAVFRFGFVWRCGFIA